MAGFLRGIFSGLFVVRGAEVREKRLFPSGISVRPEVAKSFEEYQEQSRSRISGSSRDNEISDEIIFRNAAYYLKPENVTDNKKKTVLLVHGLTDTPYSTKDIGEYFSSRGFHVLSIVLPGHGTCPGDLLTITSADLLESVTEAITLAKKESDELYLAGFSLGAALILHHVLTGTKVNGVLVFSPAIRLPRIANLSCALVWLSKWFPHLKWLDILPDTDLYKYETLAMNAICESSVIVKEVRKMLRRHTLDIPVFISASEDDATVIGKEALFLYRRIVSTKKQMIYYAREMLSLPTGVRQIQSSLPQQHVVSAAHTSAYVHPDNPYYGRDGNYASCAHLYRTDPEGYLRCKAFQEDVLGEIGVEAGSGQVVRRLTFNPWYDILTEELDKYFNNIN